MYIEYNKFDKYLLFGLAFTVVIGLCLILFIKLDLISGQSYQVGNNTVANVTAIIDINDESLANSSIRLFNDPYGEPVMDDERYALLMSGKLHNSTAVVITEN